MHDGNELSVESELLLEEVCGEFESAWQAGETPEPGPWISNVPSHLVEPVTREFVWLEVDYRRKRGESFSVSSLKDRYQLDGPLLKVVSDSLKAFAVNDSAVIRAFPKSLRPIVDSGLMTAEELSRFCMERTTVEGNDDAETVTGDLVSHQHLTACQAELLLSGRMPLMLNNYVLMDKIGAGGMGTVYKARHRKLRRTVALKLISPEWVRSETALVRFQREARVAALLVHPNIATVFDADEDQGFHYIAIEYIDGKDLDEVQSSDGQLTVSQAVDWMLQAARGLEGAHHKGIIHRDVKPSNLMLDVSGRIKVLDLGLAKCLDSIDEDERTTTPGAVLGTFAYLSPEQLDDSEEVDERSDIYSLGCTFIKLLTGEAPLAKGAKRESLANRLIKDIPIPENIDESLRPILARMTRADREQRYSNMGELIAELEGLQASELSPMAPKSKVGAWVGLATIGLVAVMFGIIIKLTLPNGKVTELRLPDGTKIELATDTKQAPKEVETVAFNDAEELRRVSAMQSPFDALPEFEFDRSKLGTRIQISMTPPKETVLIMGDSRWAFSGTQYTIGISSKDKFFLLGKRRTSQLNLKNLKGFRISGSTLQFGDNRDILNDSNRTVGLVALTEKGLKQLSLFEMATKKIDVIEFEAAPTCLSFSSNGKRLAIGFNDGSFGVFSTELRTMERTWLPPVYRVPIRDIAISPDGKEVAYVQGGPSALVVDIEKGGAKSSIGTSRKPLVKVNYSDDGASLITGDPSGRVSIWSLDSRHSTRHIHLQAPIRDWRFASKSSIVAFTLTDGTLEVWDQAIPKLLWRADEHSGDPKHLRFNSDESKLVTSGVGGVVQIWNVKTGKPQLPTSRYAASVSSVLIARDNRWIAASYGPFIFIWDPIERKVIRRLRHTSRVNRLCFAAEGTKLCATSTTGESRLWDIETWTEHELPTRRYAIWSTPTDQGRSIAYLNAARHLNIYSLSESKFKPRILLPPDRQYLKILASPDGEYYGLLTSTSVLLVKRSNGELTHTLADDGATPSHYCFHPKSHSLAMIGKDGIVRVFEVKSGKLRFRLEGHESFGKYVEFSPDGRWLYSSSYDGTVREWDLAAEKSEGRVMAIHKTGAWVHGVSVSADGRYMATANSYGSTYLIRLRQPNKKSGQASGTR